MYLVLSMLSSRARLLLADDDKVILARSWQKSESQEMGDRLPSELRLLLTESRVRLDQLKALYCASGPGSFSGLRISSAFFRGLAYALKIPLRGIPTFEIYDETVSIPVRALKAESMSLEEYLQQGMKFLIIEKEKSYLSDRPAAKVLGFAPTIAWPEENDLFRGMKHRLTTNEFHLDYGYAPDFVKN